AAVTASTSRIRFLIPSPSFCRRKRQRCHFSASGSRGRSQGRLLSAAGGQPRPVAAEDELGRVFADAVGAIEEAEIPYVLIGGLGSSVRGRPRSTDDVDLLVRPDDALRA